LGDFNPNGVLHVEGLDPATEIESIEMKKEHPTPVYDEEVLAPLEIESMELKKVEVTEKIKKLTDEIMEFDKLLPVPEQKWQQIPKKVEEEYDRKNLEHKKADLLKEEEIEDNHQLFHELPQPS
jgi:hypothetical protein